MLGELSRMSLQVLRTYYQQSPDSQKSLGEVFRRLYPALSAGTNVSPAPEDNEALKIHITSISDSVIVLVGQQRRVNGNDPAFKNADGSAGELEETAVLTKKGVRYASLN